MCPLCFKAFTNATGVCAGLPIDAFYFNIYITVIAKVSLLMRLIEILQSVQVIGSFIWMEAGVFCGNVHGWQRIERFTVSKKTGT